MSSNTRPFRVGGVLLLLFALAGSLWASSPVFSARTEAGSAANAQAPQAQGGTVTTASDGATSRISASLRDKTGLIKVVVQHNVSAKANLLKVSPDLHTRAYALPDGSTVSFGQVDASLLPKLAGIPGVQWIGPEQDGMPARIGPDGPITSTAPTKKPATAKNVTPRQAVRSDGYKGSKGTGPQAPEDWFDVDVEHNARQAWENGYDGEGVVVAVVDSGVDFGHPDLQGTFARINSGPYEGWPYAYDNYGTAYWEVFGAAQTVDNWNGGLLSYYVDTSETVAAPFGAETTAEITTPVYDRFSDPVTHEYTLPATSKSGVVHIGFHPDAALGWGWTEDGGQPAIAVVDENTAGVYDTVYVDLDNSYTFDEYEKQTKENPVNALDYDGDGLADESAGMIFWIADGVNGNPGAYIWSDDPLVAGAGDLVGFMFTNDIDVAGGSHGLQCASNVVGQGHINGIGIDGSTPPPYQPADEGVLWGTANKAKVAAFTVYSLYDGGVSPNLYGALGPDGVPGTGDEVQVSSNSYGDSSADNDGWEAASRNYAQINYTLNPYITFLSSSGNGAAGYGTVTGPSGATVIKVGANTTYGSNLNVFDWITREDQINWGDTQSWSGRGPGATGKDAPDVLANGAWGTGATPINQWGDGNSSYETWGGTSRSSPVASGVTADLYDAFYSGHGRWPTYSEARHILMSSANDNGHDGYLQGSGVVDALRATNTAAGAEGIIASPSSYQPGSFNGVHYGQDDSFTNILTRGEQYTGVITLTNAGESAVDVNLKATRLVSSGVVTVSLATNTSVESPYDAKRPDYLPRLIKASDIPAGTTFMVVQQVYPFNKFNPGLDYNTATNNFRLYIYDWTDINGDGNLWTDDNGNGAVNIGEIDQYEYNRFNYGYDQHTTQEVLVGNPIQRMHDGIFLGVLHRNRLAAAPSTPITLRVTFYKEAAWSWVTLGANSATIPAGGSYGLNVTTHVPSGADPGLYEAMIRVIPVSASDAGVRTEGTTQIPVSIQVAAESASFTFGGDGRQNTPYDNNVVWGYQDWGWRAESGDWRFFDAVVPGEVAGAGKFWLVNTNWTNYPQPANSIPTDIDTYLYGPTASSLSNSNPARFGPYTLGLKGGSTRTLAGAGVWRFQTATGGTEEWVSGPLSAGLNQVQIRTTLFSGQQVDEPFSGKSGVLSVSPYPIVVNQSCGVDVPVSVNSTLAISPLSVKASGLSAVITTTETITQDAYTDVSFTLTNPALLDVRTVSGGPTPASDVDLYVYRIVNGSAILVGASESATANEQVRQVLPPAGEYLVRLYGFTVSPSPGSVLLVLNNIDGTSLQVTSAPSDLLPNHTETIHLQTASDLAAGTYNGALILGPQAAPGAAFIPITVVASGDCPTATPSPTETEVPGPTETPTITTTPEPTATPVLPFSDVHDGDYFFQSVNWLYQHGAISGYADGTFKPYNTATRAQLVKIVVLASGMPIALPLRPTFSDVPSSSGYFPFVETAYAAGIISGYNDDNFCGALPNPCFKPDNDVTRAQIAKIVTVAAGWELLNPATPYFADVPTSDPFYQYIETAHAHYVISGYDCGIPEPCPGSYYRPGNKATRGQIAKIVYLSLNTPVVDAPKK